MEHGRNTDEALSLLFFRVSSVLIRGLLLEHSLLTYSPLTTHHLSKCQHGAILVDALLDFAALGPGQPVEAEAFDGEAGPDGAMNHGSAQPAGRRRLVGGAIA